MRRAERAIFRPAETGARKRTIPARYLVLLAESEPLSPDDAELHTDRPRTRGDCVDGPRPCPWLTCRHHLALDVNPASGALTLNWPKYVNEHDEPDLAALPATCSLDVGDLGGVFLEDVAASMNLVRERARQIEGAALTKLREAGALDGELVGGDEVPS